jgi:hypothetical protein
MADQKTHPKPRFNVTDRVDVKLTFGHDKVHTTLTRWIGKGIVTCVYWDGHGSIDYNVRVGSTISNVNVRLRGDLIRKAQY